MPGISLLDQLASSGGNDQTYLAEDPFYLAGRGAMQMQLPQPTNNTEAILGPLLKGLTAGSLMGYGKHNAYETAFNDYKGSPLIQALASQENIGPVASGDAYANSLLHDYTGDMPDKWTPAMGKQDLILGALAKNKIDEQEQHKQELKDSLASQIALMTNPDVMAAKIKEAGGIEQAKVDAQSSQLKTLLSGGADKGNLDAAIALAPKSIQPELIKEKAAADKLDSTKKLINDSFDQIEALNKDGATWFGKVNPLSDTHTYFATAKGNITASLQELSKTSRIPAPILQALLAKTPQYYESDNQLEIKRDQLLHALDLYHPGTPMLNAIGATGDSSADKSNQPIPTGQKTKDGRDIYIVNGVKGVLE